MKRRFLNLLILILFVATAAHAAPVQRIRNIKKPLFNIPAIVKAGDAFELVVAPENGVAPVAAYLYPADSPNGTIALNLETKSEASGLITYAATVATDVPEALYDVSVYFPMPGREDDIWDIQPHAVKVVREFKSTFDFVHLTDIHFNVQDVKGQDMNRIRRLLQDIAKHKPEFILFTGDLGLNPETYDRDYVYGYEELTRWTPAPIFMVPGNHELYFTDKSEPPIDGLDYWTAAYGPTHSSFDYGNVHFVNINTFDWPQRWRNRRAQETMFSGTVINAYISPEQWNWLKADLAASAAAGKTCVAASHIPIGTLQGGRSVGIPPKTQKVPGPTVDDFTTLLNNSNCSHIFIGHMHYNEEHPFGALKEELTRSSGISSGGDPGEDWGYRIVHVKDGKVTGWDEYEIGFEDLK